MIGLTPVVFHPVCETEPYPGVKAASNSLYTRLEELTGSVLSFDRNGAIHKTGLGGAIDFISKDACGSVPLYLNESDTPAFMAIVHSGMLTAVVSANRHSGQYGFRFSPCWEMDLRGSESVTDVAICYDGESMIELIQMIDVDRSVQVPRSIDLMAAIALCDKDRLHGLTTQQAWAELTDIEQQTVMRWLSTAPQAH
ncbi:hypothetical protein QAO71_17905 (plasmid) [Halopseudomonas sp. SMJS2]|uniref:hypothetical protein n=1 Tax=Halopseudomonas sp. SMJS2 TaxID=3041098 RepID=UPI0024534BE9|nr:hypothetical protein [Halopseudomonas sp. SMJS2]WGK63417.1 hypothetical protein QAO71_17905 [Halopseudomonas sp. SMJS2]